MPLPDTLTDEGSSEDFWKYELVCEVLYWNPDDFSPLVGDGWYESEPGIWRREFLQEREDAP